MIDFSQKRISREEFLARLIKPPVVYGIGSCGRLVADTLRRFGSPPACFLDQKAQPGQHIEGIKVFQPDQVRVVYPDLSGVTVILGLFNHSRLSHARDVSRYLKQIGCGEVVCYENFYQVFLPETPEPFWLADPTFYLDYRSEIEQCSTIWADEKSRNIFNAMIQHRLGAGYEILPEPDWDDITYLPKDVPLFPPPYNFIDAGAYDGDTINDFIRSGVTFQKIIALEPDVSNFSKLVQRREYFSRFAQEVYFIPAGLGESCQSVRFDSQGIATSKITDAGNSTIPIIPLDSSVYGFIPDYIKLDIEGAERGALNGMRHTVEKYRPMLAVCVYHHPQDLFLLPLMVRSWQWQVDLYLRMHSAHGLDTVMYVIPRKAG
jgi:FkbM family methyltransferase